VGIDIIAKAKNIRLRAVCHNLGTTRAIAREQCGGQVGGCEGDARRDRVCVRTEFLPVSREAIVRAFSLAEVLRLVVQATLTRIAYITTLTIVGTICKGKPLALAFCEAA
jgi:hypothetical protein